MRLEQDFDINLLIPDGKRQGSILQAKTLYLLVVCLVVLSWIGVWGWYTLRERDQRAEIARLQDQLNLAVVAPNNDSQAHKLRAIVARREAEVKKIEKELLPTSELLTEIEASVPPATRLTEVVVTGDRMVCHGLTADYLTLAEFISSANRRQHLTEARCMMAEPAGSGVRFEVQLRIVRG